MPETDMFYKFFFLDQFLLFDSVESDKRIPCLVRNSKITHIHGGYVVEKMGTERSIQRKVLQTLLDNYFGFGDIRPKHRDTRHPVASTPTSRTD